MTCFTNRYKTIARGKNKSETNNVIYPKNDLTGKTTTSAKTIAEKSMESNVKNQ